MKLRGVVSFGVYASGVAVAAAGAWFYATMEAYRPVERIAILLTAAGVGVACALWSGRRQDSVARDTSITPGFPSGRRGIVLLAACVIIVAVVSYTLAMTALASGTQ